MLRLRQRQRLRLRLPLWWLSLLWFGLRLL
jgi:hypothetical protein